MSLFWVSRLKYLCFLSLEACEEDDDPMSPLVFQVTHRRPPSKYGHNVNVVEQQRHLPGVSHWEFPRR